MPSRSRVKKKKGLLVTVRSVGAECDCDDCQEQEDDIVVSVRGDEVDICSTWAKRLGLSEIKKPTRFYVQFKRA